MPERNVYRANVRKQKKRRVERQLLVVLLLIVALAGGYMAWSAWRQKQPAGPSVSHSSQSNSSNAVSPAPSPTVKLTPEEEYAEALANHQFQHRVLEGSSKMVALPYNGKVTESFFDNAVFVGDSLTQGLQLYKIFPNSGFAAYKGAGPNAFIENGKARKPDGSLVFPIDEIRRLNPGKLYILLGTNSLPSLTDEAYILYYAQMLDYFGQWLPGVPIYIQSMPPTKASLVQTRPYMSNDRIRSLNDQLAKLAAERGIYFVDVYQALVDEAGNMREEITTNDGFHTTPTGYQMWKDYLLTHTANTPGAEFEVLPDDRQFPSVEEFAPVAASSAAA